MMFRGGDETDSNFSESSDDDEESQSESLTLGVRLPRIVPNLLLFCEH